MSLGNVAQLCARKEQWVLWFLASVRHGVLSYYFSQQASKKYIFLLFDTWNNLSLEELNNLFKDIQ